MNAGIWFWLIYVVSLILWLYRIIGNDKGGWESIVFWVLIAILGYAKFGGVIKRDGNSN